MRLILSFILVLFSTSLDAVAVERVCPDPWVCERGAYTLNVLNRWTGISSPISANIRSGYLEANPDVAFLGNVIYYEGLADSMVNHLPLFATLTKAGFRVIAFDYMGQGGSTGSMNDTRIREIAALGEAVWRRHARDLANFPRKNIIGWSTGGLAAHLEGNANPNVNAVVLIAPGIVPNVKVGEQDLKRMKLNQITLASLTTAKYGRGAVNPHIDRIFPASPLDVMDFGTDLLMTAFAHRLDDVREDLKGFVLLSGKADTYVDAKRTLTVIRNRAPHFIRKTYDGALHEIDNEREPIATRSHEDIRDFLIQSNR